jgi:hypothetical protein
MTPRQFARSTARCLAYGAGLAAGAYATYTAATWLRYGKVRSRENDDGESQLDRFIPTYEVVERHCVRVKAPADITFATICDVDLEASALIRAIFKGRELMLGSDPDPREHPRGLLASIKRLGWGVLAEVRGREVVLGAVTQPWEPNVVFRALPSEGFAAFNEPGYVKIVFTLRADPIGADESLARTETRAVATDPAARSKFRRYWSIVSPGVVIIRRAALALVRTEAERQAREGTRAILSASRLWQ